MADWNGDGKDDWLDDLLFCSWLNSLNDDTSADGCGCSGCLSWILIACAVLSILVKLFD